MPYCDINVSWQRGETVEHLLLTAMRYPFLSTNPCLKNIRDRFVERSTPLGLWLAEGGRPVFEVGAYYLCAVKHEEVHFLEQTLSMFQNPTQVFRKAAVNAEGTPRASAQRE